MSWHLNSTSFTKKWNKTLFHKGEETPWLNNVIQNLSKQTCCAGKPQTHRCPAILELLYFCSLETSLPATEQQTKAGIYSQLWSTLDLHHLITAFTAQFGKQINLEMTKSMELALQLKNLGVAFPLGWKWTVRGFTCLVSQGFVDLADQPGEGAAVHGLGQGVPGIGCLLQVQGTHQLQAGAQKNHSAAPQTKGSPFPASPPLNSLWKVSCSWWAGTRGTCSGKLLWEGTRELLPGLIPFIPPASQIPGMVSPPPLLLWSSCGSVHPEEQSHPLPAAAKAGDPINSWSQNASPEKQPLISHSHWTTLQHQSLPPLLSGRDMS